MPETEEMTRLILASTVSLTTTGSVHLDTKCAQLMPETEEMTRLILASTGSLTTGSDRMFLTRRVRSCCRK